MGGVVAPGTAARYLRGQRRTGPEIAAMNKIERTPRPAAEAQVQYLDGDFRVMRPGSYVRCVVTGAVIPLDELRYWSAERQEAYATPQIAVDRLKALGLLPSQR
jgi:hypothetical protein